MSAVPSCRVCIAGSFPPPELRSIKDSAIAVVGSVSEQLLELLYLSAGIAIVPLRFGAGVKGKVIEALSYGTPVVATSIGAEGIPDAEKLLDICDTPAEFARSVIEILRNPVARLGKALAGLDFVEAAASPTAAQKALATEVPEIRHWGEDCRIRYSGEKLDSGDLSRPQRLRVQEGENGKPFEPLLS
jgi:O-antigen biosynthesis protein